MKTWTHDGLQSDLASHLAATRDRIIWEDMQLGPSGSPRPDVYTIPKAYANFRPLAYEIKISVADFRRDVTDGKWQKYLEFACGVTFAVPAGLVTKADIPHGCGLMVRGDEGWRTIKAPTLKVVSSLPHAAWMKLLIDGIARQQREDSRTRFTPWIAERNLSKKFGNEAAKVIAELCDTEAINLKLEERRQHHDLILDQERKRYERDRALEKQSRDQVDAEIMLLEEALGLEPGSGSWDVVQALRQARAALSRDNEIARLNRIISSVRRSVGDEVMA